MQMISKIKANIVCTSHEYYMIDEVGGGCMLLWVVRDGDCITRYKKRPSVLTQEVWN